MMKLDREFAAGVRDQLLATARGISPLARHTRRMRIGVGIAIGLGAAGLLTGGAVVVGGVIPGVTIVSTLGLPATATFTGTATVELGARPNGANGISFALVCLNEGDVSVEYTDVLGLVHRDEMICTEGTIPPIPPDGKLPPGTERDILLTPVGSTLRESGRPLPLGVTSFDVVADSGMKWTIVAQYVKRVTTEWGVNASGQTYGTPNEKGDPDLEAVMATNGTIGFSYIDDLLAIGDTHPSDYTIPVYESDGSTVIGEFRMHVN
jgi:hypothetical protein